MRLPLALTTGQILLKRPLTTGAGPVLTRSAWYVAAPGGYRGEAAPLPGFGGETPGACSEVLAQVCQRGIEAEGQGDDLGEAEILLTKTPCARSAVAQAVASWRAFRAGVSLSRWYAQDGAQRLRCGGLGRALSKQAPVKHKVSGDPLAAAAFLHTWTAAHPGVPLRADANGSWTLRQAEAFLSHAPSLDYLEDPLPVGDPGWSSLTKRWPLAMDAGIRSFQDVAAARDCVAVVLKPHFLGGFTPTQQAAQVATGLGLRVVVSSACEGACGLAHVIAIAAGIDPTNQEWHGLDTGQLLTDAPAIVLPVDGWLTAP